MNLTFRKKAGLTLSATALMFAMTACGDINNSWEVKGGGYLKYKLNDDGPYTIELAKNDVEPPFYVNNSHHYFFFCTRIEESKHGDQLQLMVTEPQTGKELTPVNRASLNGRMQTVSWFRANFATEAPLITDSSTIKFDQIIKDSLWTADLDLYFYDCRSGSCSDSLPPLHLTGRFRYWVPDSER